MHQSPEDTSSQKLPDNPAHVDVAQDVGPQARGHNLGRVRGGECLNDAPGYSCNVMLKGRRNDGDSWGGSAALTTQGL